MLENVPLFAVVGMATVGIALIAVIATLVSTSLTVEQRTTAIVVELRDSVDEFRRSVPGDP